MPNVAISDASIALLHELEAGMRQEHPGASRTQQWLVDDAIRRVHRGFFGLAPGEKGSPETSTGSFRKWASDRRAVVLLRQVDPTTFRLAQPFRYDDGNRRFSVPENDATDLASVPRFLTWVVPRYGRHTLAALLHDNLQRNRDVSSQDADVIFREAMAGTGVPLSRRWLMWAAVALRTKWKRPADCGDIRNLLRKARVILWVAVFGLTGALLWPMLGLLIAKRPGEQMLLSGAIVVSMTALLPLVLAPLWGRLWRLGVIDGLALLWFSLPVILVVLTLFPYLALEWAVEKCFVIAAKQNPVFTGNLKGK